MKKFTLNPQSLRPQSLRPDAVVWKSKEISSTRFDIAELSAFTRALLWLFSDYDDKRFMFQIVSAINVLYKANGASFTVLYLKESHRLVMKQISGHPDKCNPPPRVATKLGLPSIIPGHLRKKILDRDACVISMVLGLLTVYRILHIPGQVKLNTITDEFSGVKKTLPPDSLKVCLGRLSVFGYTIKQGREIYASVKAGPNTSVSLQGLTLDAYALMKAPKILSSLKTVASVTAPEISDLLDKEIKNIPQWLDSFINPDDRSILLDLKLGKLAEKEEAAGKIRVFAITDIWTQSILLPLHDFIFRILKTIPMDGTFDQLKPLKSLTSRGLKNLHSFDLSAATDRLPIDLQVQVLSRLISPDFAEAWKSLLVDREWYHKGVPYLYSVGQPMGALSSWGMLALTHHVIIQEAARRVGWDDQFKDYAVLGDDVVIADKVVAQKYHALCTELGVTINLSKTLESDIGVAEFAKRLVIGDTDVSPISPKLVASLLKNNTALPEVLRDMMSRGLSNKTLEFVKVASAKKTIKDNILWEIIGPLGFIGSDAISPFLGERALSSQDLKALAEATTRVVNRNLLKGFYEQQQSSQVLIDKLGTLVWDGWKVFGKDKLKRVKFSHDTPAFQHVMSLFMDKTVTMNTTQPESVEWPEGKGYTYGNVYQYIRTCVDHLDASLTAGVPDFTQKDKPEGRAKPMKYEFYRSLDAELKKFPHLRITYRETQ